MPINTDQLVNGSSSLKPFSEDVGNPTSSRQPSGALVAHQNYEKVAGALAESGNQRLQTINRAIVNSRKRQIQETVNLMKMAASGELDLMLIMQELGTLPDAATQDEFVIEAETSDLFIELGLDVDAFEQSINALNPVSRRPLLTNPDADTSINHCS